MTRQRERERETQCISAVRSGKYEISERKIFVTQQFVVLLERVIPELPVLPRGNFLINVKRGNPALQNNSATIKHEEI